MRRALVLFAGAALVCVWVTPAAASCAAPPPLGRALADARTVFVGTVTATSNQGRWALVAVTDVWKGDVQPVVDVRGGPADPPGELQAESSVDRTYEGGRTYLFVPYAGGDRVFLDNVCSSTTPYRDALSRFRPPGARALDPPRDPPETPDEGSSLAWWAAAAAVAGAGAALAWRRRAAV